MRRRAALLIALLALPLAAPILRDAGGWPADLAPPGSVRDAAAGTLRLGWRWPGGDPLLDGLVYWWPASESGGATLADASGAGNTGTLQSGATVGSGYVTAGGVAPSDRIVAPASTSCAGATAFTLSADVYIPSTPTTFLLLYVCDNGTVGIPRVAVSVGTDRVATLFVRDADGTPAAKTCTSSTTVPLTTWTRITATVDTAADKMRIRVGGTTTTCSVAINTFPSTPSTAAPAWGERSDSTTTIRGAWRGRGLGKWSVALTSGELDTLHAGGWAP